MIPEPTVNEILDALEGKGWDYEKYGAPGKHAAELIRSLISHLEHLEILHEC